MTQIVTELVIDAAPAERGAQDFIRSMDLAEGAATRLVDQTNAVDRAIAGQTTTMTRSTTSTTNYQSAFNRLRNSVDPAARAQYTLERATRTVNSAVARGVTTQGEAARILDLVRRRYDAAGTEAGEYSTQANRAVTASDKASQAFNRMIGYLATLGIALGVKELIQYADAWTSAGNRITAVSGGTAEETAATRSALADLAVETRSDFESTVALYSRLAGASEALGATQEDLFSVVRTVNESIALMGGNSSAASGAIVQLAQALGSGQLRGDEFNSIMENAPVLADAIAREMGVASTELRGFAEEGAITSQIVFDALLNSADTISASFQATQTTVAQALTSLSTRFTEFIGGADSATGASQSLVEALDWVSENIDTVAIAIGALGAALVTVKVVGLIADLGRLGEAFAVVKAAASFLLTNPFGLAITAVAALVGGIILMNSRQRDASVSMEQHEAIVNRVKDAYVAAGEEASNWAATIEGITQSEALLNLQSRRADLAEATRAEMTGGVVEPGRYADDIRRQFSEAMAAIETEQNRIINLSAIAISDAQRAEQLAELDRQAQVAEQARDAALGAAQSSVAALRLALQDGLIEIEGFNAAVDNMVNVGQLTARSAVDIQAGAAAWLEVKTAVDQAQAVYDILRGVNVEAAEATLGLTSRVDEANTALAGTPAAGNPAAAAITDVGEAATTAAGQITAMEEAYVSAFATMTGGGVPTVAAGAPGTVANVFHDGGVVGQSAPTRIVPAALFAGAPRFHTGLASDEFPAILQRGETVIPAGGAASSIFASVGAGVTGGVTDSVSQLADQLKEAKSAAVNFGVSFVQALIAAKSPLEALQGSLSSLSSTMLSSAGQSFMTGNFAGGIIKGVIGIVAGLIARRIAERRELMAAQEAWRNMSDELAAFAGRLAGDGEGALAGAIAAATAEMQPFIDAAKKAKASTAELEAMLDGYARKVSTEFLARFGMLVEAFESGLGQGSPAVVAAQNVAKVGAELLAFVDDARVATETLRGNGDAIREAEGAAQAYALSLLRTPPALSEVQTELLRIEGTAAALTDVLVALGLSSAEAAAAIDAGVSAAFGDLRQQFSKDLGAKINDALGRGYINEVSDLVGEAAQLLQDATALGLSGTDVSAYFAAQAQRIVDGAGLTGDAFADLIDLFPELAGVVTEASGSVEAALERINDAAAGVLDYVRGLLTGSSSTLSPEARLRNAQSAYDAQIALAQGGDLGAQQKITGFADALLQAARTMFASSAGYQDIFARVTGELLGLPAVQQATDPSTAALRDSLGGMSGGGPLSIASAGGVSLGVTASGSAALPVPANDRGSRQNFVDLMQVNQGIGTAQIAAINGAGDRIVERLEAIERVLRQQAERPRRAGTAA